MACYLRAVLRHLAALALAASLSGCWTGDYLWQQGRGQFELLRARRRVSDVLSDPGSDVELRRKLRLAMEAREFGVRTLGLRGADAYTRYLETGGEPIAWNLSAAPKDKLVPWINRFPIVGAVPYLGYFREADAKREEARLQALGLDTYVREVSGYSTLGITADPIYSSMLDGSDASIVEVVLHEMTHGTIYVAGQSEWDESLATLVGLRGAAAFFAARGSSKEGDALAAQARKRQERTEEFARYLSPVLRELEALYARPISRDEKVRLREEVFERARVEYLRHFPPPPGKPPGGLAIGPMNNARLVSYAVYHQGAPEHERLLARLGGDLAAFVRLYKHAVDSHPRPIAWLKSL